MSNENESEILEGYAKILMQCVLETSDYDDSLIKYLLNYKKEVLNNCIFYEREVFGVIKTNFWGYIKKNCNEENVKKWAKLLEKDINEVVTYQYLKFNFSDNKKRNLKTAYDPLYFNNYGKTDTYTEVSENFINTIKKNFSIKNYVINVEDLNEVEMRFIINDCLNDNNLDSYIKLNETEEKMVIKLKYFIIDNYEEMELLARKKKKSVIKLISNGNNLINKAFQSIAGKERKDFIEKYNTEEKFITYIRQKDISTHYLIDMLHNYKDKDFWIKIFECYDKKTNIFSIKNVLKDFFEINDNLEQIHDLNKPKTNINLINNLKLFKKYKEYTHIEHISQILTYFKEEIKNSNNYKQEMEKLLIISIQDENEKLYKLCNNFMCKDNGYKEDMNFKNYFYLQVFENKKLFLEKMKKLEITEMKEKMTVAMPLKNNLNKKNKI